MKIEPHVWWGISQKVRFLIAGGFNTLMGYLVFGALFLLLRRHLHYLGIGVLSQAVSLTIAFVVYRRLVFRSNDRWQASFIRFNLSQLVAFGFGISGLYCLVHFGDLSPLLAQAIVIVSTVVVSYILHRYYSFRLRPSTTAE